MIEYLLALAIPRRDTKQIAKDFDLPLWQSSSCTDRRRRQHLAGKMDGRNHRCGVESRPSGSASPVKRAVRELPILSSWQSLLDYLLADMAHLTIERVRTLYLNSKNMLIRDEVASEGSVDQAAIYTREVIRRAMDLGAAAIILVHNHPSGDSAPSRQDIAMTRDIADAGKKFGIAVHDHIIIGKNGFSSMRSSGLI